jgi:phage terminase large subunit-like protein
MTTTPKPTVALRRLMTEAGVVVTRAGTLANRANLAPDFIGGLQAIYGGTRLAAQELEGLVVEALEGALWRSQDLARARGPRPDTLDQVVVAVDPPASATGDACGLVVAGRLGDRGYVLADLTLSGASPLGWAGRAAQAARDFGAAYVVAEANQGGDMVRTVLAMAGCDVPVRLVHARLGKRARAEPVAALYEQGRITHCGAFPALEEELLALGTEGLDHSPDRADALVWALSELLLNRRGGAPRLSVL